MYPGQLIGHPLAQFNAVMNSSYDPCMTTPCEHGGACFVYEDEVQCKCAKGFLGKRCELRGTLCRNAEKYSVSSVLRKVKVFFQGQSVLR